MAGLSADAMPAIVARLDNLGDACEQLAFLDRIGVETPTDVRSWNPARSRAVELIAASGAALEPRCQS